MSMLPLQKIKPGYVLLHDVKDRCGRLLLGAGSCINDRHLQIFKAWGVPEANVHDPEREGPIPEPTIAMPRELSPEEINRARAKALELFRHADISHPAVVKLYEISLHIMAREMNPKSHHGDG